LTPKHEHRPLREPGGNSPTRRGPLRPEQLVSVRQHQARRLAGHGFRAVDTIYLLGVMVHFLRQVAERSIPDASVVSMIPVVANVWSTWLMLSLLGLYRLGRNERPSTHAARLGVAVLVGAGLAALCHALLPAEQARTVELAHLCSTSGAGIVILHVLWWTLVARWRSLGLLTPNIVVVGANRHAEEFISAAVDRRDMNILGVFDDRSERSPLAMLGVPVLGTIDTLIRHRMTPCVDLIVVTVDPSAGSRVRQIMDHLATLPNPVTMLFDEADASRRAAAIEQIADAPLRTDTGDARRAFAKRVQDLVIGSIALVVFGVPMALIALAIRLDSTGPVFFRQHRRGFNNEVILVWKFRSMRHEAADETAERQVTADDDRVTRVGRVLRSTSLDELPQLFNVMSGEMSLVGPRPHALGMKTGGVTSSELVARYAHRCRIKPGMTGWAAINGSRGPLHEPEDVSLRVAFDIEYIVRQSVLLDLLIMLKTIPALLGDRTAVR